MKIKIPKMNKRADISITILVFMILFLFSSSLFIFITQSGRVSDDLTYAKVTTAVYSREGQIMFFMAEVVKNKAKEAWENGNNAYFESNMREKISAELGKYLENREESNKVFMKYLKLINEKIETGDFSAVQEKDYAVVVIKNMKFEAETENHDIKIQRISDIEIKIPSSELV